METIIAYVDGNGYIEMELSQEVINICSNSGDCEEDVIRCLELPEIKKQFKSITDNILNQSLYEVLCDYTKEEIKNMERKKKEMYALWIACCNAREEQYNH